jgi:hypothetical protein
LCLADLGDIRGETDARRAWRPEVEGEPIDLLTFAVAYHIANV